MNGGAYGAGKATSGQGFDAIGFLMRPHVMLRSLCWLFSVVVFACISTEGWTSDGRCQYDGEDSACTLGNVVGVVGFLAASAFLVCDALFDSFSSIKIRRRAVIADMAFCGGFMPYGVGGVLSASATCFFAYVGFDAIAASGEEARNPQRSLPVATFLSMFIVTSLYVAVSAVLTLIVSYKDISPHSGLPAALAARGARWAELLVTVGALAGMSTVLIGTLFALTRIAYAMADDGLIHSVFARVASKSKIPLVSMYVFSFLAGVLAVVLDIETLVEMMSIGTLSAYLIVSGGVVVFRYRPTHPNTQLSHELKSVDGHRLESADAASRRDDRQRLKPYAQWLQAVFPRDTDQQTVISWCVSIITVNTFIGGFFARYNWERVDQWWSLLVLAVLISTALLAFLLIGVHQQCQEPQKYRMPMVPLLPVLSIVVNAILMTTLQLLTWARLLVWLSIGLSGYFFYGLSHSKLN